jgi:DNA-binding beta-propeller fold protein YncE
MNTQDDNNNIDEFLPFGSFFEDLFEFIKIPRKYPQASQHAVYRSIGQRATIKRVIAVVSANTLIVILGLLFVYSQMAYWPPVYKDLQDPFFDSAFFLLMFTSFFVNTTIHFLIFRAVSGKGKLIAHMYLNAIGSTWSLISIMVAGLILVIIRIRNIDAVVMVLAGIYLIYATFLSLQAIHLLSDLRAIVAMVITTIATIPSVLLNFFLFGFLIESRPFQIDNLHLLIFFLSVMLLNLWVMAYVFREQKRQQPSTKRQIIQSLFGTKIVNYVSIILLIPLTVFIGLSLYKASRPKPVIIGNSSLKPLGYYAIDAEYSDELNSIVMISDEPDQLHVFDPVSGHQTSFDISSSPTKVTVNPKGTHAAVSHYQSKDISYVDLQSGQVQIFHLEKICENIILSNEWLHCRHDGSPRFKSVEISTGNTRLSGKIDDSGSRGREIKSILGSTGIVDSIVGVSHSLSTGNYLVITETDRDVILIDSETLEKEKTIPFPEIQVGHWTEENLPKYESLFFKPVGRFVFTNNKTSEYYLIAAIYKFNLGRNSIIITDDLNLDD